MKKQIIAAIAALAILATGCAPANTVEHQPGPTGTVSGLFNGWWNGATAGLALIGSIFNHQIAVYDVHNDGLGYNLGYLLGIGVLTTGATIVVKKK